MRAIKSKISLTEQIKNVSEHNGLMMPFDEDIEKFVLGSVLAESPQIFEIVNVINPEDFFIEKHKIIFKAILEILKTSEAVSTISVIKYLRKSGESEFCGGAKYLATLTQYLMFKDLVKNALYIVELSKRRQLIALTSLIAGKSYDNQNDVFELIGNLSSGVSELLSFKFSKKTDFIQVAEKAYSDISSRKANELPGIPSKFREINKLTGGYRRGNLYTIAGRPGMGKSLYLVNEAYHQCYLGQNVIIFSLEMPSSEVSTRIFSLGTTIETWKLDKNNLTNSERDYLQRFIYRQEHKNLHIDDSGGIDLLYITSQIKKIKNENESKNKDKQGVDLVYIDYLQLMKLDRENRNEGLGEITRSLKSLAKELNICIVIFSQLNRAVETRGGDKRPQLSDLKESGSIEEDSDVVQFLYRAFYYGISENEIGENTEKTIEVITAKNRQGGKDSTFLNFLPTISTITENNLDGINNNSFSNQNGLSDFEKVPQVTNKIDF